MYDFFRLKKSGFPDFLFPRIRRPFSQVPWKTVDQENTVVENPGQMGIYIVLCLTGMTS
jgi:hypothetical protein